MHANASPKAERGSQEIRFTRNAQAVHFFVLALIFFCVGIALYCLSLDLWKTQEPLLKRSWYGVLTLPFIGLSVWAGVHLAKHAYMIFSPIGVEIFPFFYPSKNMQVLYWQEVEDVAITPDGKMLEVTLLSEGENKIFIATEPLRPKSRDLLGKTIDGIRTQREESKARMEQSEPSLPS